MINIAITGAAGRMGRTLIEACVRADGMRLSAAIERPGSAAIGSVGRTSPCTSPAPIPARFPVP